MSIDDFYFKFEDELIMKKANLTVDFNPYEDTMEVRVSVALALSLAFSLALSLA